MTARSAPTFLWKPSVSLGPMPHNGFPFAFLPSTRMCPLASVTGGPQDSLNLIFPEAPPALRTRSLILNMLTSFLLGSLSNLCSLLRLLFHFWKLCFRFHPCPSSSIPLSELHTPLSSYALSANAITSRYTFQKPHHKEPRVLLSLPESFTSFPIPCPPQCLPQRTTNNCMLAWLPPLCGKSLLKETLCLDHLCIHQQVKSLTNMCHPCKLCE